jgi:hypothetical protein|tara:strand:+ start:24015 stop:24341 length:327 start_codon:yes stop_codon:yes gene_type:complete
MANVERLTKRVKGIEKWIAENEGGPTLDNINYLIDSLRNTQSYAQNIERQYNALRNLNAEFLETRELMDDWNAWLEEKQNAVQEQQTEEVSVQSEAESSEEASEAQEE